MDLQRCAAGSQPSRSLPGRLASVYSRKPHSPRFFLFVSGVASVCALVLDRKWASQQVANYFPKQRRQHGLYRRCQQLPESSFRAERSRARAHLHSRLTVIGLAFGIGAVVVTLVCQGGELLSEHDAQMLAKLLLLEARLKSWGGTRP